MRAMIEAQSAHWSIPDGEREPAKGFAQIRVLDVLLALRAAGWQITDPITHEEQALEYAASLDNDPFKD